MLRQWASRKQRNSYIYIYIIGIISACLLSLTVAIFSPNNLLAKKVKCSDYNGDTYTQKELGERQASPAACGCIKEFTTEITDYEDPLDAPFKLWGCSKETIEVDSEGDSTDDQLLKAGLQTDPGGTEALGSQAAYDSAYKSTYTKWCNSKLPAGLMYEDWVPSCTDNIMNCSHSVTWHSDSQYNGQVRQCLQKTGLAKYTDEIMALASQAAKNGEDAKDDVQAEADAAASATQEETPCESNAAESAWLVCPAIDKASNTAEDIFSNQLYNAFSYDITANSALKDAWQSFLPLGNIVLAIVFLIMIYSLATSTGMSNYTIKKVLPRLIIAAIAINLSFYICALAVDLSNIIGANIKDFLKPSADPLSWLEKFGTGAVTTIALVFLIISSLSIVVIGGLLLLALIALRSTLLTIMIVISPIAFAFYLLPNTKKWFDMYVKEFSRLLIAYPLVSAVWGAAMLTEGIMDATTSGFSLINTIITPLLVLTPVVAVLPILKMSGNAMSLANNKLNGLGAKARDRYRGSEYAQKRQEARKAMLARRKGAVVNKLADSRFGNVAASVVGFGSGGRKTGQRIFQGYINRAASLEAAADAEELKSNTAAWSQRATKDGMSSQDMLKAMESGSYKGRRLSDMDKRALINHGFESGSFSAPDDISRALDVAKDTKDAMIWDTARSGAIKAGFPPGYMFGDAGSKGAKYNKSDAISAWANQLTTATAAKAKGNFAYAAIANGNREKLMSDLSKISDKQYQDIEDVETKNLASLARSSASSWMNPGSKGPTSIDDLASLSAGGYDALKTASSKFTDSSKDNTNINNQIKSVFNSAGIQDANQARALTRQVAGNNGTIQAVRVFSDEQINMFVKHGDIKASPQQATSGGQGDFASSPRP